MNRGGRLLIQENYSSSATMSTDFEDTPLALEFIGFRRVQLGHRVVGLESRLLQHRESLGPLLGLEGSRWTGLVHRPMVRPRAGRSRRAPALACRVSSGGGPTALPHRAGTATRSAATNTAPPGAATPPPHPASCSGLPPEHPQLVLRREVSPPGLLHHLGLPDPSLLRHRIHRPCLGRPAHATTGYGLSHSPWQRGLRRAPSTVAVRACWHTPEQARLDPQRPSLIERT